MDMADTNGIWMVEISQERVDVNTFQCYTKGCCGTMETISHKIPPPRPFAPNVLDMVFS